MIKSYIDVYYQPLEDIASHIKIQLIKLNNRWNGRMLSNLKNYSSSDFIKDAMVFYTLALDGTVASWAMVYKEQGYFDKWDTLVDFYTKKSERGNGYASCIAKIIREVYPNTRLHGETENSTIFKRFNIKRT